MLISAVSIADDSYLSEFEIEILDRFGSLLEDKVTCKLLANYKDYLKFPNEYLSFLEDTLLNNWDFGATTKALIGGEIFNSLSQSQFIDLSNTLEMTLIRYAFESLPFYGEQKLSVIDITVNEEKALAWLKIKMDSPRLPDIHLDLLLKRTEVGKWLGVDFQVKGISYVSLKKSSYRQDFENLKFDGLIKKLNNKNQMFYRDLCKGDARHLDSKHPPCFWTYDNK